MLIELQVAIRSLLGAFESIITPALILITSQWYTKRQACPRIGIWYCGLGAGQIVGGLISWAGQHGSKTASFEGWRIMMVSVGVFNVLVALAVIFALPDSVETASFLSPSEKERVTQKLTVDQAGNGKRVFKKAALFEALADPAIWLLFLITILILVPSGVVTTFSATILAGLGYNSKKAALLNMGSGAVSIFATLASTFAILFNVSRWLSIVLLIIPSLIGAALMSFLGDMRGAGLAGVYLVNFCVAPSALTYALVASNTQGYTKKVVANCGMQVAFGIGNIIGPQTFRAHEAPGYLSAKITVMSVNAGVIVVAVLLRLLYGHRNAKRDQASKAQDRLGVEVQRDTEDATDLTNPAFRYVY